jgi:hypothetical protein
MKPNIEKRLSALEAKALAETKKPVVLYAPSLETLDDAKIRCRVPEGYDGELFIIELRGAERCART